MVRITTDEGISGLAEVESSKPYLKPHALFYKQFIVGAVEVVHHKAIEYGDREVWGAEVGRMADITIASHGSGETPASGFDSETLRRACLVTKPQGIVIVPTDGSVPPLPDWREGEKAEDALLDRLPLKEFAAWLRPLSFSELMRLHERRDWRLSRREIQWRVKTIRGEFYRRRWLKVASERQVVFTPHPQDALDNALAKCEGKPNVLILPEGSTTLPKVRLHRCMNEY